MRLSRMILRGFKSFADRTEIEFAPGVTAIVGPNGSGKSNIADAVRWVLGEQSIRQLRGEQSADIIFSGTETHRAKGSAEVTLIFDNADEGLMPDVAEVSVTRRLLRSGDSEFYINKRACRLKDIHMLFADTGLGKDSMAVIGQNKVDRILVGKPEERKLIFEEVAGISRFKLRKNEGLRKLAEAERNMVRVNDVVALLEEELEPLAERAKKAEKFAELQKEKEEIKLTLTWQKYRSAERQLTRIENEYLRAQKQVIAAQTALTTAESLRQERLQQQEKEDATWRELEREASRLEQEGERVSGEYRMQTEQKAYLEEKIDEIHNATDEAKRTIDELKKNISGKEKSGEELLLQLKNATAEEEAVRKELLTSEAEQAAYLESEKEREALISAHQQRLAAAEAEKNTALRESSWLEEEEGKLQLRYAELEKEVALLKQKTDSDTEEYNAKVYDQKSRRERLEYKQGVFTEAKQKEEEILRAEQERINRLAVLEERCRYLERLAEEHEGFSRATKNILNATTKWRSQVVGTVADILDVPARYTTAIDIALGGALQHLVVRDGATATAAVRYLQNKRGGRTTFYPLTAMNPRGLSSQDAGALREDGVIGTADNCVNYDSEYRNVVVYLLGRTLIVRDMETARRLVKLYHARLRMVTLDGQLFQPGGSITGGSTKKTELTYFGRRRELAKLKEEAEKLRVPYPGEWPDTKTAAKEIETLEKIILQTDIELATAKAKIEEYNSFLRKKLEEYDFCAVDLDDLRERKQKNKDNIKKIEETIAREEESFVLPVQLDMPDGNELRARQEKLTQHKVLVAELHLRNEQLEAELKEDRAEVEKHERTVATNTKSIFALEKKKAETQNKINELRILHKETSIRAKEKRDSCESFYQAKEERRVKDREAEKEFDTLRRNERDAQVTCAGLREKTDFIREECKNRQEELAALGYTEDNIESILRQGNMNDMKQSLSRTEAAIVALGPVNPTAIEDFEAAKEKHEFYRKQLQDMEQAKIKLQEVLKDIELTMNKQFREAFVMVAEEFQRIFTHLFGGGVAKLEIVEAKDEPIGGVEIYIQPPGKKRQPLTLLSGGERALTVIALLFSFMAYRPAPFCLVDEVDAALDDANVQRFRNYLRDGRNDMQFIVITHRKTTMEAADVLQGVTMEEKGISKMIAVDLQRYEE